LVKQDISRSGGVITEISENVFFVDWFDIFIIAHDPSTGGSDHGYIMPVMRATVGQLLVGLEGSHSLSDVYYNGK